MSQREAVEHMNAYAIGAGKEPKYRIEDLRRWEMLGTPGHKPKHGKAAASMEELQMLMHIYKLEPNQLFPETVFDTENAGFERTELRQLVSEFGCWRKAKQAAFLAWLREGVLFHPSDR